MISWKRHPSPLGPLLLAVSARGLCGLTFSEHKYFKGVAGDEDPAHPILQSAARQLDEYFAGGLTQFDLPLDLDGTPFQLLVWESLRQIPFGVPSTYRQQAALAQNPLAVRAVGSAIGRNPVSIIVPCQRVLRTGGALAGYAGGLERKRYLLALEARQ
jgi:methylated-DNA-[protein]-cysteine S-methyltransferase